MLHFKVVNADDYKTLSEQPLTEKTQKDIAKFIHNKKEINNFKNHQIAEDTDEMMLAENLLRYLRDNPLTKIERAADGNFLKVFFQGFKGFVTQWDSISGPKLKIAHKALVDLLEGASATDVKKYGLMACEYARYLNPLLKGMQNVSWHEVKSSGKLEVFFGLQQKQPTCKGTAIFATQFLLNKDHFITQSIPRDRISTSYTNTSFQ